MVGEEARVLSLSELRDRWDYVWIERRAPVNQERTVKALMRWIALSSLLIFDTGERNGVIMETVSGYGVRMRCWTVRPTERQMHRAEWY